MQNQITINDILPAEPIFRISALPGRDLAVRPPNMADHVWFIDNYKTVQHAQAMIANRNWQEICRIVYYLMSPEDRALFPLRTKTILDDEGREVEKTWRGFDVLLMSLKGIEEATGMLAALTRAIMLSNPKIQEAVEEQLKKNLAALEEAKPRS